MNVMVSKKTSLRNLIVYNDNEVVERDISCFGNYKLASNKCQSCIAGGYCALKSVDNGE
jgi:hypothetical protein